MCGTYVILGYYRCLGLKQFRCESELRFLEHFSPQIENIKSSLLAVSNALFFRIVKLLTSINSSTQVYKFT